MTCCTYGLWF